MAGQAWAERSGPIAVAEIPQPDGLVEAGGGQGTAVGGERYFALRVGLIG